MIGRVKPRGRRKPHHLDISQFWVPSETTDTSQALEYELSVDIFFQDLTSFKSIPHCSVPEKCEYAIFRLGFLPASTGHGVASKFSSTNYSRLQTGR